MCPATMSENLEQIHLPVLLERCLELLGPALGSGALMVDATLGIGGHSKAVLQAYPQVTVIGIDRDPQALALSRRRLAEFAHRFTAVHAVYDDIDRVLDDAGIGEIDAILFDLGVSSMQLDRAERGFAYALDAPLDMRMDSSSAVTAADIVAGYSEAELRDVFWRYGEEKLAPRYARAIVAARECEPIKHSGQLVDVLSAATPAALRNSGHPAKRVFQALRIEVNQELSVLERALPAAMARLRLGGRIVVMAYQSLEDRIVKHAFAAVTQSTAPHGLPQELPEHEPTFRLLVRGAERAGQAELASNRRANSVRLRAAERVRAAA